MALRLLSCAAAALLAIGGAASRPAPRTAAQSRRLAPLLARSVQGRRIEARHLGSTSGPITLVVGAIHGDESAGTAIVHDLIDDHAVLRANLWVVPSLNPDGVAAHTRQNAHGVDLNRNFPWRWHPNGHRGDAEYPGPAALSEPESRFAAGVIANLRPRVTVWFHQPLGIVDLSGGSQSIERRFARAAGIPASRLPRYRGSATTWQNHRFAPTTAFVVELPAGRLDGPSVERYAAAVAEAAR